MYFKRFNGCILKLDDRPTEKGALDIFIPETCQSRKWRHWVAQLDSKLCPVCLERHGTVYKNDEEVDVEPPLHVNCRCAILPVEAIKPGFAQKNEKMERIIGWPIKEYFLTIIFLKRSYTS